MWTEKGKILLQKDLMHQVREIALRVLYELDVLNITVNEAVRLFWNNFDAPEESKKFSSLFIECTRDNLKEINSLIGR